MSHCPHCGSPMTPRLDLSPLTRRQADVIDALRSGLRLTQIARHLELSLHTVRNHLKQAYRKLGVHSQVELLAMLNGQIPYVPREPRRKRGRAA